MGGAQRGKPGRPRNTTHQDMKRKDSIKIKLLNDISSRYQYLKTMHYPSRVPTKVFNELITEKKIEYAVSLYDDYFDVPKQLIYQRIKRQKQMCYCKGAMSPTQHLEEAMVAVMLTVADTNKPQSSEEGIKLKNEFSKTSVNSGCIVKHCYIHKGR